MNPKYMGLDVVFLYLFEKYYITNQVDWLEKKDKDLVFNRAYSLMGNIVGEPAAELNLLDTLDKKVSLYSIKSPYTILVFWDPDCSHCREQVPKLDSMYRSTWKKQGIQMVGVLTDTVKTDLTKMPLVKSAWTKYIREHQLEGWVHLYQTPQMKQAEAKSNLPGFRQTYDVYQTPTIYLLDEQKRIVAKKISPEQVDEFLEFKRNNKTNQHP
jgi:thiol-disulfide isomerase/thioredoxin